MLSSFLFEFPVLRCFGIGPFRSFRFDAVALVFGGSAVVRVFCFSGSMRVRHGSASLN